MKKILVSLYFICIFSIGGAITVDDSSGLNPTQVSQIIHISKDAYLDELKNVLKVAKEKGVKVTVCGARHTQGGHTSYPQALFVDLSNLKSIQMLDETTARIQAGATWKQVIEFLHPLGLSVDIMQSDDDFSIGGTVSANAHGWQANKPPIVSSIKGFHILTANGTVIYCTRQENSDLFKAAIGGYGLLGMLLDVDFTVRKNHIYKLRQQRIEIKDFACLFKKQVKENTHAEMALGHFSVDKKNFLKKVLLIVYDHTETPSPIHQLSHDGACKKIKWKLFNKTYESEFYKKLRLKVEKLFIDGAFGSISRNKLLYRTVDDYFNKDPKRTDLLQEYFIPIHNFEKFAQFLQSLQNELSGCLLNMTVRHVGQDTDTVLAYASQEMLAFVMYFRGEKTASFDSHLGGLSRKMTEYALELGGSYYLPYRPYQTREQFIKAYPNYQKFCSIKLQYDPDEIFFSHFYDGVRIKQR